MRPTKYAGLIRHAKIMRVPKSTASMFVTLLDGELRNLSSPDYLLI
jgi:hypothetical protein